MELLSEKYADQMHGVLNCYDRIVIAGHLQPLSYAKGMTKYLYNEQIRIFDYKDFAQPLRDLVRENAVAVAQDHGVEIEFVTKSNADAQRKAHSSDCGSSEATTPDWFTFSRPWKRVQPICPGTTSRRTRPM